MSHRRTAVLVVSMSACATNVQDGVFSSASGTATVGSSASASAGDEDPSESSEGDDEGTDAADGVSGPVGDSSDDGAVGETTTDDGGATINPLDEGGTTGELDGGATTTDPTIDPTDDPTLDPTDDSGGNAGDCCLAHGGLGCADPAVEACVCGVDDVCCSAGWDDICVQEAGDLCGAPCGGGGGGGDCCTAHVGPGCSDPAVEGCVCGFDSFCCDIEWDDLCASEAALDCGALC